MSKKSYVFSKKDYNNPNGMLTSVWGPSFWHVLHTISVNYPVNPTCEDKQHYKTFVMSLKHVLPCRYCRDNLDANLKKAPLNTEALKNRENFSKWMYKLHEIVNQSLGKKSNLKFREVQDRYEHFRARCSSSKKANNKRVNDDTNSKTSKTSKSSKSRTSKTRSSKSSKSIQKGGTEKGCTDSIYGVKARCKLHIVPHTDKGDSLLIHNKCKGKH
jgi:hypothetical protein